MKGTEGGRPVIVGTVAGTVGRVGTYTVPPEEITTG